MFEERNYRWPGSKLHHTLSFIEWCSKNIHNTTITKTSRTPFAIAISENCECRKTNKKQLGNSTKRLTPMKHNF